LVEPEFDNIVDEEYFDLLRQLASYTDQAARDIIKGEDK
jgi:hypothetical protein